MRPNPVVLCDANVLYGQWLRDLVMHLGLADLIQPRWSERIEEEWITNLLEHRPDLDPARVRRTADLMNRAIPAARVPASMTKLDITLPDPDDVHVIQSALAARAKYLLTFNLADFSPAICQGLGIQVIHPDSFLMQLFDEYPEAIIQALLQMQRQKVRPPVSWEDLAQALQRAGLPKFSRLLLEQAPLTESEQD